MAEFPLYGGAVTTVLPIESIDVSRFRQVPDTQEVFIIEESKSQLDRSIIIDLLEKVPYEYEEAMTIHIEDLVDERLPNNLIQTEDQPYLNTTAYFSFVLKGKIITLISLMSLDIVNTDILISINIPVEGNATIEEIAQIFAGNFGANTNINESYNSFIQKIIQNYKIIQDASLNFNIKDWALFGV